MNHVSMKVYTLLNYEPSH